MDPTMPFSKEPPAANRSVFFPICLCGWTFAESDKRETMREVGRYAQAMPMPHTGTGRSAPRSSTVFSRNNGRSPPHDIVSPSIGTAWGRGGGGKSGSQYQRFVRHRGSNLGLNQTLELHPHEELIQKKL